jgi:RNA polymerase-binding transcription factor DksA
VTTTSSRTSIGDPTTGAKRAAKATSKKTATAVKAVPKPARGAAAPAPPTRRQSPTEARRSATSPTASAVKAPVKHPAKPAATGVNGLPPLRDGEEPWTLDEVQEIQAELSADATRLHGEIALAEHDIADLLRDSGEGAGDDQADAGTKNFEREHEMAIANNARDMLNQTERALARLVAGTYGVCESCDQAVGKYRLQAFPRATLCMPCKQKQERR